MNPSQTQEAPKQNTNILKRTFTSLGNAAGIKVVPSIQTVPETPKVATSPTISPEAPAAVQINTTPIDYDGLGEKAAPPPQNSPAESLGSSLVPPPAAEAPAPVASQAPVGNNLDAQEFRVTDSAPADIQSSEPQATIVPAEEPAPFESTEPAAPQPEVVEPAAVSEPVASFAPQEEPAADTTQVSPENKTAPSTNPIKDKLFWSNREKYLTPDGRLDKAKLNADVEAAERAELLKKNPLLASDLESEGISVPKAA